MLKTIGENISVILGFGAIISVFGGAGFAFFNHHFFNPKTEIHNINCAKAEKKDEKVQIKTVNGEVKAVFCLYCKDKSCGARGADVETKAFPRCYIWEQELAT